MVGYFTLTHRRKGKSRTYYLKNATTAAGILALVNATLISPTALTIGPWYYGLISNKDFISVSGTDTMASHSGWKEMTGYDADTRKEISTWLGKGASAGSIRSRGVQGSVSFYRINRAIGGIQGMFMVNDSEKGGTAGVLYNTAIFSTGASFIDFPPNTFLETLPGDEIFLAFTTIISTTPVVETP